MGDRCYLSITIRKQDEEKFLTAMRSTGDATPTDTIETCLGINDEDENTYTVYMEEANYAMTDQRQKWAKEVNFTGYHGAGGTYGPMRFIAWAGELLEVDSDWESYPMIHVNEETGQPSPTDLAFVQKYLAAVKAFNNQQ